MANILAMQQYCLKDFEGGYEEAFRTVRKMGIDTVEPWCGAVPTDPNAGTSVAAMRSLYRSAGVRAVCGHISIAEYDARYSEWRQFLRDLGSSDWVIPFAKAESLDEWLALLPVFRRMADRLRDDGFSLAYHNHHMELARLGDRCVMEHLLDNMPDLKAQFHIGQFKPSRGIALPDWIRKYRGRVVSLHLNDSTEEGSARLGAGTCRAVESIETALDTGVTVFIIEVMLTRATHDDVKRDVEFAQRLIS
ncbi:MAG: hypothetical protein KJ749_08485 [Planctomycetes bacterium]|nr:hypothetical protein [Planctomycetota bacterium]